MKRRYVKAIPIISMFILCQAISFTPSATLDSDVTILDRFNIESLVQSASEVLVPSVQAKADWNDNTATDDAWLQTQLPPGVTIGAEEGATPRPGSSAEIGAEEAKKNGKITLQINGAVVKTDVPPYTIAGRTLVPVRIISESLGAKVSWDGTTKSFTVVSKDGKTTITGTSGKSQVTVNGKTVLIDPNSPNVVVEQKSGRVFVPIRFFAENFGAEVGYDATTKVVSINTH